MEKGRSERHFLYYNSDIFLEIIWIAYTDLVTGPGRDIIVGNLGSRK